MFTLELEPHNNYYEEEPQYTQQSQDRLFASVINFLIEGKDIEEAQMLLASDFALYRAYNLDHLYEGYDSYQHIIQIQCQRKAYDALCTLNNVREPHNKHSKKIDRAFEAVLASDREYSYEVKYSTNSVDMSPGWRERLHELARHGGVEANNQGLGAETSDYFKLWKDLKFRSKVETRVAEALEKRAVMFFPLPRARLGLRNSRETREPDFLVCHKGKWGILEVDGPHHTGRAADDHGRDRLFKQHGTKVIEHYNADECFKNADKVVNEFLNTLEKLG